VGITNAECGSHLSKCILAVCFVCLFVDLISFCTHVISFTFIFFICFTGFHTVAWCKTESLQVCVYCICGVFYVVVLQSESNAIILCIHPNKARLHSLVLNDLIVVATLH
jgi:hypothetical protein